MSSLFFLILGFLDIHVQKLQRLPQLFAKLLSPSIATIIRSILSSFFGAYDIHVSTIYIYIYIYETLFLYVIVPCGLAFFWSNSISFYCVILLMRWFFKLLFYQKFNND
jgi:hypothetical protein